MSDARAAGGTTAAPPRSESAAVAGGRRLLGATKPSDSAPGTIRGDFAIDVGRNIIHGSDSVENARKEIDLWFPEGVSAWESASAAWVYE